jgi:GMP synthase-like glutamine amidotransferase
MTVRALLVANVADADAGCVGDRFRHHGFDFQLCGREEFRSWPGLDAVDLVVLLGSDWSVYWPHVADEVAAEVELIREAQRSGIPQFGICFGSQSMAQALGGHVARSAVAELGWHQVTSHLPSVIAEEPWFQWHYDVVTLPFGAELLASGPVGPQAWRIGRGVATQFHPEVTESVIARWSAGAGAAELERFGIRPEDLIAETRAKVALSRPNADRLVDWFLEECSGRSAER